MNTPPRLILKSLLETSKETNYEGKPIKVICAWCNAFLRGDPDAPEVTSHGMCKPCALKELQGIKAKNKDKKEESLTEDGHKPLSPRTQAIIKQWLNRPSSVPLCQQYATALEMDIPDQTMTIANQITVTNDAIDDRVREFVYHLPGTIRAASHTTSIVDTTIEFGISVFTIITFGTGSCSVEHWKLDEEKALPRRSHRMLFSYREYRHLTDIYDVIRVVGVASGL